MIEEITYKTCSKCGEEKPLSSFYKNKGRKDGVSVYCAKCMREYFKRPERVEYEKNRTKLRSKTEEYKKYQVQYQMKLNKKKYNEDYTFRIMKRMRNLIGKYITRKQKTTNNIIGCSSDELVKHLEKQFQIGMTWENYGEWHIDHIIPQSLAKTEDELYRLNHYTNLQPLWKEDNLRKSNKISEKYGNI